MVGESCLGGVGELSGQAKVGDLEGFEEEIVLLHQQILRPAPLLARTRAIQKNLFIYLHKMYGTQNLRIQRCLTRDFQGPLGSLHQERTLKDGKKYVSTTVY